MKFAGRMNSFIFKGNFDLFSTISRYHNLPGITHLEFNYPEHVENYDIGKLRDAIGDMKVNGVATRFKNPFINGEFTNPDKSIRKDAINLCLNAIDACSKLGGNVLTIWQAYDSYDYPFQIDYECAWNQMIDALKEITEYAQSKNIKVSIEYKPFEPRNYAMLDSFGTTMLAIKEVGLPNIGMTLDFCHMLMKHDNPSFSLVMAARDQKLFGLHMNDGYSSMDSGLIFGSVHFSHCLEFVYYLKKYQYDGVVFFDTFPIREDAFAEISTNIKMFNKMDSLIDHLGMSYIQTVIEKHDGTAIQHMFLDLFPKYGE